MHFQDKALKFSIFSFVLLLALYGKLPAQVSDPSQIPGLILWLRADTGVTLTPSSNPPTVQQWSDISGSGNHCSQTTIAARPVLSNNTIINNRSCIDFNGTNNLLNGNVITGLGGSSLTIFVVAKGNQVVSTQAKGFLSAGTTSGFMLTHGNGICSYINGGTSFSGGSLPLAGFPYSIIGAKKQFGIDARIYINGAQVNMTTNSVLCGNMTNAAYKIGQGVVYFKGEIAEVILYNNALDTNQINSIEDYLYNRYAPSVNLGPDIVETQSLCPVTITAGNRFVSYLWSTGESTPDIIASSSGSYWVQTTDVFGRISRDTIMVTLPNIALQQTDTTLCLGQTLSLSCNLSDSTGYTYLWPDGATSGIYSANTGGNYFVRVGDGTCFRYSDTISITIDSLSSQTTLGNDTFLCVGNSIGLQVSSSNWENLTFQWSNTSADSIIIATSTGNYSVTVTNSLGCIARDTVYVTIIGSAPIVQFPNDTICLGATYYAQNNSFSSDTSSLVSFEWIFDGTSISYDLNPTFNYVTPGIHSASLSVTTSVGCSNSKGGFVLVNSNPMADFNVDNSCINIPTNFEDLSSAVSQDTIVQWMWQFGDGGTSFIPSPSYNYTTGGIYNVEQIVTNNKQCSDTLIKTIVVVNSAPQPPFPNLFHPLNATSLSNNTVLFSWQSTLGVTDYKLIISDSSDFSAPLIYKIGNTNQHIVTLAGDKTYYWKVRAFNVCLDSVESPARSFTIFSPSDIMGLTLWLRADTGVTLTPVSNPPTVQQWNDISGNNYNCSQTAVAARPVLSSNNLINNRASIDFNGNNSLLNGGLISGLDTSSMTLFVVTKGNQVSSTQSKSFFGVGTTQGLMLAQGNGVCTYINGGTSFSGGSLPLAGFPYSMISAKKHLNTDVRLYTNGVQNAMTTSSILCGNMTNGVYKIGYGTGYLKGEIAEVILYKTALDTNQMRAVENYIYNRYAPPVNLGPDIVQTYSLCPVTLDAGNRFVTYQWSTGDITSSIQAKKTGSYWVQTTDVFGRTSRDTINITIPYLGVSPKDTTICNYNSVNVSPFLSASPYSFLWNTQQTAQIISPTGTGHYVCAITDTNGCTFMSDSIRVIIDSFATLSILSDTAICSGNKLALKLVGYTPQSVLWNDGSSNNYNIVSTQGSYAVTVTDVNGCVNNDAAFVQVKSSAPSLSNFSAPNVCFGTPIQFTDLSNYEPNDPPKSWSWIFGDVQTVGSTQQNPTHLYLAPGDYSVTFTFLTDSGCSGQASKVVTAAIPPIPAFGFPTIICAGTQVILSDQTVFLFGDSIANWVWTFNGVDSITTKNAVYEFPSQGSYLVKLKAISKSGCSDTTEQIVDVFPPLAADFSIQHVCLGDSTAFVDVTPALSVVGWQWNFGDFSFPSVQQSPKHKYATAGSYNVTLTVENAIGCVDKISKTVNVVNPPTAKFGNLVTCEDQYYAPLDSSIVSNDTISTWKWTIAGTNYNTQAPEHLFADTGNYNIKLKITTQSGCIDSANKIVSVKPHPKALFSFTPLYGDAPVDVSFINQSTNASNYFWDFGDGITSSDPAPFHTYNTNDTFSIRLKATSNYGCEDSSQRTFIVAPTDLDVAVLSVTTTKKEQPDGSYLITAKAKVANLGTRIITNVQFYVTIGSGGVVSEEWVPDFTFATGMTPDVIFTAQFVVAAENANSYVCVTAVSVNNGETEISTANNSQCSTTSEGIQLIGPSPNPMSSQAQLGIILPKAGEVTIDIADMAGQYVVQGQLLDLPKGRSNYTLPVDKMLAAEYFIRVYYNDEKLVRKFIVAK